MHFKAPLREPLILFQTWVSFAFPQKFCVLHVRHFQNKITYLLRPSYVHVCDYIRFNKWCNIRVSKGYFVAKYKKFPRGIAYCVLFANISAFFTSMYTHVRFFITSLNTYTYIDMYIYLYLKKEDYIWKPIYNY